MSAPTLSAYARRAFWFRPYGMFVPPNVALLGVFALLGFLNPGLWLIGLGLEVAYVLSMVSHPRFRRLVEREHGADDPEESLANALGRLSPEGRARYTLLRSRCEELLGQGDAFGPAEAEALSSLMQVYLELLGAREGVARLVAEADPSVAPRLAELRERLAAPDLDPALQASLAGQEEVLAQRARGHQEAERKLRYVDGELARVEDQVELLREQALLEAEPAALTRKIDTITTALGATRRWLAEERATSGIADASSAPMLRPRPRGQTER